LRAAHRRPRQQLPPEVGHRAPQRSFAQWVKSQPVYDRLYALYENSRLPFIRKYHIDMAEFEPVQHFSFAEFFRQTISSRRPELSLSS
jgi:hypothetical protein